MADREPEPGITEQAPELFTDAPAWPPVDPPDAESALSLDLDLANAIEETLAVAGAPPNLDNQPAPQVNQPVLTHSLPPQSSPSSPTNKQSKPKSRRAQETASLAEVDATGSDPRGSDSRGSDSTGNGSSDDAANRPWLKRHSSKLVALRTMPSWLVSMMVHIAILMSLAAVQIDPVQDAIGVLITAVSNDEGTALEEGLQLDNPTPEAAAPASAESALTSGPTDFSPTSLALPDTGSLANPLDAAVNLSQIGSVVENIVPGSALAASTGRISSSLSGRSSGAMKSELIERYGGNAASERSVSLALQWLADHQDRSGGWTFGHSAVCRGKCEDEGDIPQAANAATALALLPFLGAGQTHLEGKYKTTVQKGLAFLISRMKVSKGESPHGSWLEEGGAMYSHGLASIVMCEAYAMTRDPGLYQPAQLAVNYILYAQDPRGGGWRYAPKQAGDTSVVGWQLMALKSGAMGNLSVPNDAFRLANNFLDSVSVNDGAYYGYDVPTANIDGRQSTTAVGLLSRMYLGWSKEHPGLKEGIAFLAKRGPSVDDLYYSYYATQVMRQHGGVEWENWNRAMRDSLVKSQVAQGHAIGSWYSDKSSHNLKGGRLYCTAMSTMILEVYYRHMPLYSEKSADEEFEF